MLTSKSAEYYEYYLDLGAAIIRRAIEDLKVKEYREEALKWFESKHFESLCEILKINPNHTRRKIDFLNIQKGEQICQRLNLNK